MAGPADEKSQPTPTARDGSAAKKPSLRPGARPAKALIGMTISDRYRIERLLGEGGMGAVYQAEHTLMRKRMAIKVLHPEMTRLPEVVARFEREAMAAAHIDHPHVVNATDFGKLDDGSFFLALEFVEGRSLREIIAQGRLELGRALHVARQIASALSRAHSLKIVHRDLKPENVMLVEREGDPDFVKVLDFGIAKVQIGELTAGDVDAAAGPGQAVLTQAGMVYGTPEYMAPEQALGQNVDARADLYALGVIMYEMLTGYRPFNAESKVALLGMQVTAPVPPMAQTTPGVNVPPEVEQLVVRLLAKLTEDRLGDARELIESISNIMNALAAAGRIDARYAPSPASGALLSNPGLTSAIGPPPELATAVPRQGAPGASPGAGDLKAKIDRIVGGKTWLIALGGGLVGLVVLGTTVALVVGGTSHDGAAGGDAAVGTADAATLAPSQEQRIKDAIADIDKGNFATGIKALEAMGSEVENREDVHRALLKAYDATDKPRDAMREAGIVLKLNPSIDLTKDFGLTLRTQVRNMAVLEGQPAADKAAVDEAFRLLERDMGTIGWDTLYDIAYGQSGVAYPKAAARARSELVRGDRKKMSPELAVTVDLQAAGGNCIAIKGLLDRAAEKGDERTLLVLKQLVAPRIVGHFRKQDALGCIHGGDKPLERAIAELESRLKKR